MGGKRRESKTLYTIDYYVSNQERFWTSLVENNRFPEIFNI